MSGRDAARDELIDTLRTTTIRVLPDRTLELVAEALLSRGYRRSVTRAQVDLAGQSIARANGDWRYPSELPGAYQEGARSAARAFGLEVTDE